MDSGFCASSGTKEYRYGEIDAIAWYEENSEDHIHTVGGKKPNAWGFYDMLGTV